MPQFTHYYLVTLDNGNPPPALAAWFFAEPLNEWVYYLVKNSGDCALLMTNQELQGEGLAAITAQAAQTEYDGGGYPLVAGGQL